MELLSHTQEIQAKDISRSERPHTQQGRTGTVSFLETEQFTRVVVACWCGWDNTRSPTRANALKSSNPFPTPTCTNKTAEKYLKQGERHLRRARKQFPLIACPAKALAEVRKAEKMLKASTTRRYWQEHLAILGKLRQLGEISDGALDEAKAVIGAALSSSGRVSPRVPRTGAKKVRDLSEAEAAALIEALAQKVQGSKADDIDRYLLLYARLAPVLGFRPCEGVGIRLSGPTLFLPCAKNTNGRAGRDTREVNLRTDEPGFLDLVTEFIAVQKTLIETCGGFDEFYPAARQRLARLSIRVVQRRVCPYCFRHVAIATWKAAGYDAATIALLAGHSSKTTAGKHYAGKRRGWSTSFALAVPAEASVVAVAEGEAVTPSSTDSPVEATPATEAVVPKMAGLGEVPADERDDEAGQSAAWDILFETSALPVPSQRPAGGALRDRKRDLAHPEARMRPTAPRVDPHPMGIPAHADLGPPDPVDIPEEDAGLGMRF